VLKKAFFYLTILVGYILVFPVQAGDTILLSIGEWPPYFSQEFKYGGVGSRIVTQAFALEGITVKFDYMPWKRSLDSVLADSHKGSVGWRKTPEREKLFSYTDSLFNSEVVFFHRMGTRFDWQEIDDVGHLKVGVTLGYLAEKDLGPVTRRNGGKLDVAPTDVSNLLKLIDGRIDIFPCSKEVCYYLLRTQFLPGAADQIGHHPKPFYSSGLHVLFAKNDPEAPKLIKAFNRGLKRLRESGRYAQYLEESLRGEYAPR